MYVKIDLTDYDSIRNLVFSPETDITGNSVPINEFSVEIITDDSIAYGQYAELYDDLDNLWAKYWIVYAERVNADAVLIRARSDIALLDGVTLPAVMYNGAAIGDVLDETMVRQSGAPGIVATIDYSLDSSFSSATVTGFCPEQSARVRLQWLCYIIGAYVKTFFNSEIEILPIDSTEALLPLNKTFGDPAPSVTYKDWVTAVKVKAYSFTQGTPATTDTWVTDGTDYYIVTEQEYSLANSAAPSGIADNEVKVEGVYLVNSSNVSGILSRMAQTNFKRTEVALDAIDNAEFIPGDKLAVYADANTMVDGFVKSAAFSFGKQARASLNLTACGDVACAKLVVSYEYGDMEIGHEEYTLPVGYAYTLQTLYVDMVMNGHRYIFRPTTATITGTMTSAGAEVTVQYAVALDLDGEGTLEVISVDDVTMNLNTAVIA